MEYIPSYSDNLYADIQPSYKDSLMHHGIKGQKWGVRRFQNPDGSLTPEGKRRYKKSLDYIKGVNRSMKSLKDDSQRGYAISQNNYEANRDIKKSMLDDGAHTEETFRKMYPNFDIGMEYDKRTAQYNKAKAAVANNAMKRISDIDVTKHSYGQTRKLVDSIFDDAVKQLDPIQRDYINSSQYKNYQNMLNRNKNSNKAALDQIYNKYQL